MRRDKANYYLDLAEAVAQIKKLQNEINKLGK